MDDLICSITYYEQLREKTINMFKEHGCKLNRTCYKFAITYPLEKNSDDKPSGKLDEKILQSVIMEDIIKKTLFSLIESTRRIFINASNERTKRNLSRKGMEESFFSSSSKILVKNKCVKFRMSQGNGATGWFILNRTNIESFLVPLDCDFNKTFFLQIDCYINNSDISFKDIYNVTSDDTAGTYSDDKIKEEKIRYIRHYKQNVGANLTDYRNKIQVVRENNYQDFDFTTLPMFLIKM